MPEQTARCGIIRSAYNENPLMSRALCRGAGVQRHHPRLRLRRRAGAGDSPAPAAAGVPQPLAGDPTIIFRRPPQLTTSAQNCLSSNPSASVGTPLAIILSSKENQKRHSRTRPALIPAESASRGIAARHLKGAAFHVPLTRDSGCGGVLPAAPFLCSSAIQTIFEEVASCRRTLADIRLGPSSGLAPITTRRLSLSHSIDPIDHATVH